MASLIFHAQGEPDYIEDNTAISNSSGDGNNITEGESDELYSEALNIQSLKEKHQLVFYRGSYKLDIIEQLELSI